MYKSIKAYENMHIALWLVKDVCWVTDFEVGGMAMIIPTLLVSLHITWRMRKNIHDLFHNIAISLWICANGIWMTGEFFFKDSTRPYAIIFFAVGIAVVLYYYLIIYPKRKAELYQSNREPSV
ncbi:MAG: hypothetical protein IPP77_13410 [Bacteroidetes bacterium]|nr:hypothetical protein [Bacteroidota bacterium]